MDAIIGPQERHPLFKSPCEACGAPTCEKDLEKNLRICRPCLAEYIHDQEQRWGDLSERDAYIIANN